MDKIRESETRKQDKRNANKRGKEQDDIMIMRKIKEGRKIQHVSYLETNN